MQTSQPFIRCWSREHYCNPKLHHNKEMKENKTIDEIPSWDIDSSMHDGVVPCRHCLDQIPKKVSHFSNPDMFGDHGPSSRALVRLSIQTRELTCYGCNQDLSYASIQNNQHVTCSLQQVARRFSLPQEIIDALAFNLMLPGYTIVYRSWSQPLHHGVTMLQSSWEAIYCCRRCIVGALEYSMFMQDRLPGHFPEFHFSLPTHDELHANEETEESWTKHLDNAMVHHTLPPVYECYSYPDRYLSKEDNGTITIQTMSDEEEMKKIENYVEICLEGEVYLRDDNYNLYDRDSPHAFIGRYDKDEDQITYGRSFYPRATRSTFELPPPLEPLSRCRIPG